MTEYEHKLLRMAQDRAFKRNRILRQKVIGVIICIVAIVFWWIMSEGWGQFEYGLIAGPTVLIGLYVVCTKKDLADELERENR